MYLFIYGPRGHQLKSTHALLIIPVVDDLIAHVKDQSKNNTYRALDTKKQ